jgi:hypothetical protein
MTRKPERVTSVAPKPATQSPWQHDDQGGVESAAPLPELLVTEPVKALLRIGDRALNDYDRRGWLTPIKVGRRKLYRAEEVLKILLHGTPKNPRKIKK